MLAEGEKLGFNLLHHRQTQCDEACSSEGKGLTSIGLQHFCGGRIARRQSLKRAGRASKLLVQKRMEHRIELRLRLKTHAGNFRQTHIAAIDGDHFGKAAKRFEHIGIGFVAAEMQAGCNVQRHLMSAVRHNAQSNNVRSRNVLERRS